MKKIFSILFALVLVLTLSLVTAVPAGASPASMTVVSDLSADYWDGDSWEDAVEAWEPDGSYPNDPPDDSAWEHASVWDTQTTRDFRPSGAEWIWKTYRIGASEAINGDEVWFQQKFCIPGCPTSGEIYITADNGYEVWINGTFVVSGQVSAGWGLPSNMTQAYITQDNWRTVEYDSTIGSLLVPGQNIIDVRAGNEYFNTDDSPNPWLGTPSNNPGGVIWELNYEYDDFTDISLTPDLAYNPVCTNHTVTATVTPACDGVTVHFDIVGPNASESGTADTVSGVADFEYHGENPGIDEITAWVDMDCDGQLDERVDLVSNTVEKYWLEHFVTGGGNINTGKGKSAAKITFGGNVGFNLAGDPVGQWQCNFHNVNNDSLDKGHFHTTEITSLSFYLIPDCPEPDPPDAQYNRAIFEADGRFNGEDGWRIEVRLVDFGEPGRQNDAIRIFLYNSIGTLVYDTSVYGGGDFADEGCPSGLARRHLLDGGNFQIHPPEMP